MGQSPQATPEYEKEYRPGQLAKPYKQSEYGHPIGQKRKRDRKKQSRKPSKKCT